MADTTFRITYATMSADNEELHRRYEEAVERARGWLGQEHPFVVDGEERWGNGFHRMSLVMALAVWNVSWRRRTLEGSLILHSEDYQLSSHRRGARC